MPSSRPVAGLEVKPLGGLPVLVLEGHVSALDDATLSVFRYLSAIPAGKRKKAASALLKVSEPKSLVRQVVQHAVDTGTVSDAAAKRFQRYKAEVLRRTRASDRGVDRLLSAQSRLCNAVGNATLMLDRYTNGAPTNPPMSFNPAFDFKAFRRAVDLWQDRAPKHIAGTSLAAWARSGYPSGQEVRVPALAQVDRTAAEAAFAEALETLLRCATPSEIFEIVAARVPEFGRNRPNEGDGASS